MYRFQMDRRILIGLIEFSRPWWYPMEEGGSPPVTCENLSGRPSVGDDWEDDKPIAFIHSWFPRWVSTTPAVL